jgi:hypothetical protein
MSHNGPNRDRILPFERSLEDPAIRVLLAMKGRGIEPTRYRRDRAVRLLREGVEIDEAVGQAYRESLRLDPHEGE